MNPTPEQIRDKISIESNLWALKCAICKLYEKLHLVSDFAEFDAYYMRNFEIQKDILLRELEDTNPTLAALVDDRTQTEIESLDVDFIREF